MVSMLSPDGQAGSIPSERVSEAMKAGFKVGKDLISPDGRKGTVPLDRAAEAIQHGFKEDVPDDVAARHARSTADAAAGGATRGGGPVTMGNVAQNVGEGVVKGAGDTVTGTENLANAVTKHLPGSSHFHIPVSINDTESENTAQTVGKVGEGALEFMAGDAGFRALGLADKYKELATISKLMEKYPPLKKAITWGGQKLINAAGTGLVGGAQTAAKGGTANESVRNAGIGALTGGALDVGGDVLSEGYRAIRGGNVGKMAKAITPESFTPREPVAPPMHGAINEVPTALDAPTLAAKIGGKDLSTEAVDALRSHVGDVIPAGSSAKNRLVAAVKPVKDAIEETSAKMNQAIQGAPKFTTSVAQDNGLAGGQGTLNDTVDAMKSEIGKTTLKKHVKDIDAVMGDADKALNSQDPREVLEARRVLGNKIKWDDLTDQPGTQPEFTNWTRAKIYKALGDKIHAEIPETVALDKQMRPNLELRAHMRTKLGTVADDPARAAIEAENEFAKGREALEVEKHNKIVEGNHRMVKAIGGVIGSGVTGAGVLTGVKKYLGH